MAIVACANCGQPTKGTRHTYTSSVKPVGYPNPAILCCRSGCCEPGLVWLTEDELDIYKIGTRVFRPWRNTVGIQVQ